MEVWKLPFNYDIARRLAEPMLPHDCECCRTISSFGKPICSSNNLFLFYTFHAIQSRGSMGDSKGRWAGSLIKKMKLEPETLNHWQLIRTNYLQTSTLRF
jgi:hypothetical protein